MNNRNAKKLRRIANKDLKAVRSQTMERVMTDFFTHTVKPKPKWIPKKVWLWLLRRFLNF